MKIFQCSVDLHVLTLPGASFNVTGVIAAAVVALVIFPLWDLASRSRLIAGTYGPWKCAQIFAAGQ